jgi:hypothetical protein
MFHHVSTGPLTSIHFASQERHPAVEEGGGGFEHHYMRYDIQTVVLKLTDAFVSYPYTPFSPRPRPPCKAAIGIPKRSFSSFLHCTLITVTAEDIPFESFLITDHILGRSG